MRLRYLLVYVVFLMILFLERFEYEDPPRGEAGLKEWGDAFYKKHPFPLYAIVLTTKSDSEVASFVQANHTELAGISGEQCCFIYFSDIKKIDNLVDDFDIDGHQTWVYEIAKGLDIPYECIPGILFFERIDYGQYIYISLKDKSKSQIIDLVRRIFGYISRSSSSNPYIRLKEFANSSLATSDPCTLLERNAIALKSGKKAFEVVNIIFDRFFPS
jgi:hypothetical protein